MIDLGVYILLYDFLDWNSLYSTTVSISIATVYAFSLNAIFNFKVTDRFLLRLGMYSFTSFVGWTISAMLLFVLTERLGYDGTIVKILSLPLVFVVQYIINRNLTFRDANDVSEESAEELVCEGKSFAVIGGGFTGLAAAYELAKAGNKVTILEHGKDLGGLAGGFKLDDMSLERAYHFMYQSDSDTLELMDELGVRDKARYYPSAITYFYKGKHYPFTKPMDLLRFTPLTLIERVRLGVLTLYLKALKNWRPLSKVTAIDWLNRYMGKNVTKIVWEPLLKGKFVGYYDKITMSWLWGRFNIRARSQNKDFSGEMLGYPMGGFQMIIDAIVAELNKMNVDIRVQSGVQSVTHLDNGKVKVTLLDSSEMEFDSVLATVSSNVFSKLIEPNEVDNEYMARLSSVDYLDAVVMVVKSKQQLTDCFWYNIDDEQVPFLTLLSLSALAGRDRFGDEDVYYVGSYVEQGHHYMDPSFDIETEWKRGLKRLFPHFDESQITAMEISRFKNAQHIVDIGYEEKKLLPFKTPVEGVYLANFSQIYPDDRGVNFAIRDGRKVAKEMMTNLAKSY